MNKEWDAMRFSQERKDEISKLHAWSYVTSEAYKTLQGEIKDVELRLANLYAVANEDMKEAAPNVTDNDNLQFEAIKNALHAVRAYKRIEAQQRLALKKLYSNLDRLKAHSTAQEDTT